MTVTEQVYRDESFKWGLVIFCGINNVDTHKQYNSNTLLLQKLFARKNVIKHSLDKSVWDYLPFSLPTCNTH